MAAGEKGRRGTTAPWNEPPRTEVLDWNADGIG